jgi:hypothetical protein
MNAVVDLSPRWKRRLHRVRRDPWGIVMDAVGDRTVGGHSVPTTWRHETNEPPAKEHGHALAVSSGDDAFGIELRRYYPREGMDNEAGPVWSLNRREARWLAWYVFRWMAADWFGLRRRIYYHALFRHLEATKPLTSTSRESKER